MKNEALYKKTCDILFDAYFNDTLRHGMCSACAVGNICKEASKKSGVSNGAWGALFNTSSSGQTISKNGITPIYKFFYTPEDVIEAHSLISFTGYHWTELAKIEFAFESAAAGNSLEDHMYNGLVAVLDVLKEIHEVKEDNQTERFTNHYKQKQLATY